MSRGGPIYPQDFRLYAATAASYDAHRFAGKAGGWGHQRQLAAIGAMVPDWRGKRVLEIGCGTGRITEFLASRGAMVTATDIAEEMLAVARARLGDRSDIETPEFRVMSVFNMDVDTSEYDYVVAVNVFGRLTNVSGALQCIGRHMPKKCRLIFTFPCLTSILMPFGLLVNLVGTSLSRKVTSHWYTPGRIERFCLGAGLRVVRWRGHHYVPVPNLLFPALPFFRLCDRALSRRVPTLCPSVFAECTRR